MTRTATDDTPTTLPLAGRTAVVTGASSGIGAAAARVLAARGARVALLARRKDRIEELAAEIGENVLAVVADVAEPASVEDGAARVADAFGPADLVVSNAGVVDAGPFGDAVGWRGMIDVNVTGAFRVAQAFLPDLLGAAAEGRTADLVFTSSIVATGVYPSFAVYAASKAAVSHFARNLRAGIGPERVRVTNIEPGAVTTEIQGHIDDPATKAMIEEWRAAFDWLSAEEVADVIAFAVSRPRHVNLSQIVVVPTEQTGQP